MYKWGETKLVEQRRGLTTVLANCAGISTL